MSSPAVLHPSNPLARRASTLLLVLGGAALLLGMAAALMAIFLPTLEQEAAFAQRMDELRHQFDPSGQVNMRVVIGIYAAMVLTYAAVVVAMGLVARGGNHVALIVVTTVAGIVTTLIGLSALTTLALNPPSALMSLLLLAAHVLAMKWLVQAMRYNTANAITYTPLPPQPPMQAYYLPPTKPEYLREPSRA